MSYFSKLLGYLSTIIQFKDINVKEALLASSDINPDGTREITYSEAHNFTSGALLKTVINPDHSTTPNTDIESFEELEYFDNIDNIPPYLFYGCVNLKKVKFPNKLRTYSATIVKILHNTSIETLDLSNVDYINSTTVGLLGTITTLKEIDISSLKYMGGYMSVKNETPNIEKIIISSIEQWINLTTDSGSGSSPCVLPNCSDKASLYLKNGTKVTTIDTTGLIVKKDNDNYFLREFCFSGLHGINKLIINKPIYLGRGCCRNMTDPLTIEGWDYITGLGDNCFYNTNLIGIDNIPSSIVTLANVFQYSNITKAESENLTTLGGACFNNSAIEKVTLNNVATITSSGSFSLGPFTSCKKLENLSMNSLETIPYWFCASCTSLMLVSISAATTIKNTAFKGCSSLLKIIAPNVVNFEVDSFSVCSSLSIYDFNLANAVKIEYDAFYNCSNITMPYDFLYLTKIGDRAFEGCIKTKNYIILRKSDSIVEYQPHTIGINKYSVNTFAGAKTVYVPDALVSVYEADTNWAAMIAKTNGITILPISQLPT